MEAIYSASDLDSTERGIQTMYKYSVKLGFILSKRGDCRKTKQDCIAEFYLCSYYSV